MRTTDRASTHDVFTVTQLGASQSLTPEGFLLCMGVPIARLGELLYAPGEVPVEHGPDHLIRITRDETTLFDPKTLASFEGKPITLDHPDEDVNPSNWRYLAVGVARNVRRGEGLDSDKILADLLIQDHRAISQVRDGLREVSCGYEAEYADDGGGRGRQVSITGNHVALVPHGRCGPICSIGDSEMRTRDKSSTKDAAIKAWKDKLRGLFLTKDEDGFVKALEGAPDVADLDGDPPDNKPVNVTINLQGMGDAPAGDDLAGGAAGVDPGTTPPADPMTAIMAQLNDISARLTALESGGAAAEEPPASDDGADNDGDGEVDEPGEDDDEEFTKDSDDEDDPDTDKTRDKRTTKDSAKLADAFAEVLAQAEILSPGLSMPTFDAKADPAKTRDAMCVVRRRALRRLSEDHKKVVAPLLSGLDLKTATCDSIRTVFVAASELAKRSTNDRQFIVRSNVRDMDAGKIPTIAEINAKNRAHWAKTQGNA